MDLITFEEYLATLKKGWKTILAFSAGFCALSLLYCVFLFQPTFVSQSKILIEEVSPTTFVADLGRDKKLETNSYEKNPILTQMEILSSYDMAQRVYRALHPEAQSEDASLEQLAERREKEILKLQKAISLKTPPATDIINLAVKAHTAPDAHRIAQAFVDEYYGYNVNLNRQSIAQAKKYIQQQLADSERELAHTRQRIRDFRKSSSSVDLGMEASNIVKQVSDLENSISSLQGQMNYHRGKVSEYANKLQVRPGNVKRIMDSVALGQNESLINLNAQLNEAEQKYAAMQVRYPESTKKMQVFRENINAIKKQIRGQMASTVGRNMDASDRMLIKDSVRTKVLSDLIDNQSELMSIRAQKQSLQSTLQALKSHQQQIPDRQLTLSGLQEQEMNLVSIVGTLHSKLVEASVRESEIVSNVNIIQAPTFPVEPAFPTGWQVVLIMTLTGSLLGVLNVVGRRLLRNQLDSAEVVSQLLNAPVLGNLAWLPDGLYRTSFSRLPDDRAQAMAYETIATALRIRQEDEGLNLIGFTSLSSQGRRSALVATLARLLANCDHSVLVVDADFRNGSVLREFGMDRQAIGDFTELLINRPTPAERVESKSLVAYAKAASATLESLHSYIEKVPDERALYVMSSRHPHSAPYEMASGKALASLLESLKEEFDFVLVDMDSILGGPEPLMTARALDGFIALCGVETCKDDLKAARTLCDAHTVNLMGAIFKSPR